MGLRWAMADLCHEIRTPLTNIRGYVEAMLDGVIDPDAEALRSVHEEILRVERLVEALQEAAASAVPAPGAPASKSCSGTTAALAVPAPGAPASMAGSTALDVPASASAAVAGLQFATAALCPDSIAARLIHLYQPTARCRGIQLAAKLQAGEAVTDADGDCIAQAMVNLLQNALRYTGKDGLIRIETTAAGQHYRFACCNTGPEIPLHELPWIFTRSYRGEAARRICSGLGVGLAIVREIVEAFGGCVGAESSGGWTEIWFALPLVGA